MPRWNGGIIGVNNTPTSAVASGVWGLDEQEKYNELGLWPSTSYSVTYLVVAGGGGGGGG